MKRREFLLKSTCTALLATPLATSCLRLAEAKEQPMILLDKTTQPRLIIAPQASAAEKFAAQELATYLEKISGQKLAVEATTDNLVASAKQPLIVIGAHPLNAALGATVSEMEETIIEARAGVLHLVGGPPIVTDLPNGTKDIQDRGALYAVYNFLDELGVRWYRPESWGEHVPKMESVKVLAGRRQYKPAYPWRQSFSGYRYAKDETPEQQKIGRLWAIRNRQNSNVGATAEQGGSRWVMTWHNYAGLFPPDKYFAEHPEYYALIDGVRRKDGQLCLGNSDVQRLTAEKVVQFSKNEPRYLTYSLEPDDNDKWCECELCTAFDDPNQKTIFTGITLKDWKQPMGGISMSNRVNAFGKIVAEKVSKENSKLKLLWLAYSTHTEPPSRIHELPPNTMIKPAAFSSAFSDPQNSYSDYSRDLFDAGSTPNRNFVRVLTGYGKMAKMVTREYWSGIAWVGPMPMIATMKDRLQAYRKFPIEGMYNEVHPHWGPQGIDLYFFTRLLWNPDLDVEKELDLYCKNYYGPAYKPMLEYHKLLEKAAHSGIPHYSYGIGTHAIFTPPVVGKMGELIAQADKLIGDKEPYRQRFDGVKAGYDYTRLVLPYFDELQKGNKLEAAKHWERANKFILSFPDGDVFDNGVLFGSLQFFGNYNLNIPAEIQKQAKAFVAQESGAQP
jgi:hypothetical protein